MMKVLIADDEQLICSMIIKMIDWKSRDLEVVGTAQNGGEVLRLIDELSPDIVITDIQMPGINGLEMIRQAVDRPERIDFVIISGYKNFDYAHQALSMGVRHYLLKPIDRVELSATLDRIIAERVKDDASKARDEALTRENEIFRKNAREHFLSSMFHDDHREEAYGTGERADLGFDKGLYRAFLVKVDWTEEGDVSQGILEILKTLIEHEEESWECEYACIRVRSGLLSIINYVPEKTAFHEDRLETLFTKCRKETDKFAGYSITIGVGSEKRSIAEARQSMQEAVIAVQYRISRGIERIISFDHLRYQPTQDNFFFLPDMQEGVRRAVESLDVAAVTGDVQLLYEQLRKRRDYSPVSLFSLILTFSNLIAETWKENAVDTSLTEQFRLSVENLMDRSTTEAVMIQYFQEMIVFYFRRLLAMRREDGLAPVRDAKAYLAKHFSENPSLESVADEVGMSPAYFSTLFKKEVGIGFSEYLIQLRCEEAKRLMRETRDPMSLIAEKVGYQDAKYFSRIFRKTVGIKPSEYRRLYQ